MRTAASVSEDAGIVGGDSQAGTQTGPGFDGASPATFRHPLPPNMAPRPATPRLPLTQTQMIIRTPRLPSQLPNSNLSTDPRGQVDYYCVIYPGSSMEL